MEITKTVSHNKQAASKTENVDPNKGVCGAVESVDKNFFIQIFLS